MKFYRPPASLSRRKRSVAEFGLRCNPKFSGGDIEEVPPDPIPNSEVKLFGADGTATVTLWESRSLPEFFLISLEAVRCMHASRLFLFHRAYAASRTRPRSPRSEPRFLALGVSRLAPVLILARVRLSRPGASVAHRDVWWPAERSSSRLRFSASARALLARCPARESPPFLWQ